MSNKEKESTENFRNGIAASMKMIEIKKEKGDESSLTELELIREAEGMLQWMKRRAAHNARIEGASWAEIGAALKISKQSAHERFK